MSPKKLSFFTEYDSIYSSLSRTCAAFYVLKHDIHFPHIACMNFWQQFLTDLSRGNAVSFLWGTGLTFIFSGWFINFLNPSWGKFTGNATAPGNLIAAAGLVAFASIVIYKLIISLRR